MKKYKIPVTWQMVSDIEVEADSLEEAINKAEGSPLPEGTYVEDSFEVQRDFIEDDDDDDEE